jgi:hypothetical protein
VTPASVGPKRMGLERKLSSTRPVDLGARRIAE